MDKKNTSLGSEDRIKTLKESLRKALNLIRDNPVLLEPQYFSMVVSVYANDDPELAFEFNSYLKVLGTFNENDANKLDKLFWEWMKRYCPEKFTPKEKNEPSSSGQISLHRLNEALREELKEKFGRESKIKIKLAEDKIRAELSKEFDLKIKDIMENTGSTSESLNTMDSIIEKGGKKALDLLSGHLESAKGSTSRIINSAEDLQAKVKKLEEEIQYDTIPGLYTVHIFSIKFREMVDQFKGKDSPFSLAFLTVDKLNEFASPSDPMTSRKIFLGVTQQVINALQSQPPGIIPARYDANLIGILFPDTQLKEATSSVNQIRNAINVHKFVTKDGTNLDLNISAGVVKYRQKDSYWFDEIPGGGKQLSSSVFNRAIEVLQKAQSEGGNRVKDETEINPL